MAGHVSSGTRRHGRQALAWAAATGLLVLAAWLIPWTMMQRARDRGPALGTGVGENVASRMVGQAGLAVAAAQDHPVSRLVSPFHAVTTVWLRPGHCAPDEPGGLDGDRDYGATVRTIGWFGIPGRVITVRCGGAAWHEERAAH